MIRTIEKKDLKECLDLLRQLTIVGEVSDFKKIFNKLKKDRNHFIFVYEKENKIIGMATIFIEQKFIHSGGRVGHVEDVVVSENYRKMGIGKLLIDKCIQTARERKCYKIILDCDDDNLPFYSKLGFVKVGNYMKLVF